jgi:hypothetical protein
VRRLDSCDEREAGVGVRGVDDDGGRFGVLLDPQALRQAVVVWEVVVEEHDVDAVVVKGVPELALVREYDGFEVRLVAQDALQAEQDGGMVVDGEDSERRCRGEGHLVSSIAADCARSNGVRTPYARIGQGSTSPRRIA